MNTFGTALSIIFIAAGTLFLTINCATPAPKTTQVENDSTHPLLRALEHWGQVTPRASDSTRTPSKEELDFHAADSAKVKNAICREHHETGTPSIFAYFKNLKNRDTEPSEVTIAGISFKNENPELLEAFLLLVTAAEGNPELKTKNLQKQFKVNPGCKKVLCATQDIFGNHVGPKMLYLMHKFSLNSSPYSWQNADTFTDGELVDVIRALELIPMGQRPTGRNQRFIRFSRGLKRAGAEDDVIANATMEFFDPFEELSSEERQYAVLHEFGHRFAETLFSSMALSDEWTKLGGWKKLAEREFELYAEANRKGHSFVSKYAQAAPWEDFAESATAYRLNPSWLKNRSEGKYNFMKSMVFDGVTFESEVSCKRGRISTKLLSDINRIQETFNAEDINKISSRCRAQADTAFFGFLPTSFVNKCINIEATLMWNEKNPRQFKALLPNGLFRADARASRLNFPKIQAQVKETYIAALSATIKSAVNSTNLTQFTALPNNEYCGKFSEHNGSYFNIDHPSILRNFETTGDDYSLLKVSKSKLYGHCLSLYEGYTPKGLSDERIATYVRNYLKD